ncbi:MAG: DUF3027 domain-containing protein [Actinomycetaceae bacterium]|nr:DUF3027 domain-containing protein [Actinomycetaceae bacterium]MDO5746996.1 DUF3027 domain-containing protein [Actinomycetaceae bacterium]
MTAGKKNAFALDKMLSEAVSLAREALAPIAQPDEIGDYIGAEADDVRLVTHSFDCLKPGYAHWRWVATLARVPHGRKATVCEIDLLPGEGALLAPAWIPWAERLSEEEIEAGKELPVPADSDTKAAASSSSDKRDASRTRQRRRKRRCQTYKNAGYIVAMNDAIVHAHRLLTPTSANLH